MRLNPVPVARGFDLGQSGPKWEVSIVQRIRASTIYYSARQHSNNVWPNGLLLMSDSIIIATD